MSDNVIPLNGPFFGNLNPAHVLDAALKLSFKNVVVIGTQDNGDVYLAISDGDAAQSIFLMEAGKKMLLDEVV
jgi:hypothetical protein